MASASAWAQCGRHGTQEDCTVRFIAGELAGDRFRPTAVDSFPNSSRAVILVARCPKRPVSPRGKDRASHHRVAGGGYTRIDSAAKCELMPHVTLDALINHARRVAGARPCQTPVGPAPSHGVPAGDVLRWRRLFLNYGPPISTTRLVGLVISANMNGAGESSFPSFKTIAEGACIARRTAMRHLRLLVEQGWLNRHYRRHPKGYGLTSNLYVAAYPPYLTDEMKT